MHRLGASEEFLDFDSILRRAWVFGIKFIKESYKSVIAQNIWRNVS